MCLYIINPLEPKTWDDAAGPEVFIIAGIGGGGAGGLVMPGL